MSNYTIENLIAATAGEGRIPAIKIGSQVFPMQVSGGGGGGSMDFYKCASVSGADYFTVSGAGESGDSPVNGAYTDAGMTAGGKPVYSYTNNGTTYYLFFWHSEYDGDYWCIGTSTAISYYPPEEALYYKSGGDSPAGGTWSTGQGSGSAPTVTLTHPSSSIPKTWTGYKAVFNSISGKYGRETTLTSGLTWSAVQPQIGGTYSEDALVVISSVYGWGLTDWADFDPNIAWTIQGNPTTDTIDAIQCALMTQGQYVYCPDPVLSSPAAFTLSSWHKRQDATTYTRLSLSGGSYGSGGNELQMCSDINHVWVSDGNDGWIYEGDPTTNWVNIIVAWTGTNVKVWINGQPVTVQRDTGYSFSTSSLYLYINSLRRYTPWSGNGYYAGVKLYNRAITDVEAAAIYAAYVPSV